MPTPQCEIVYCRTMSKKRGWLEKKLCGCASATVMGRDNWWAAHLLPSPITDLTHTHTATPFVPHHCHHIPHTSTTPFCTRHQKLREPASKPTTQLNALDFLILVCTHQSEDLILTKLAKQSKRLKASLRRLNENVKCRRPTKARIKEPIGIKMLSNLKQTDDVWTN